jgi:hypothetical protein
MELLNESPFAAALHVFLDGDAREKLLVVAKGTWSVAGGGVALSAAQVPVTSADEYRGDPACTSLRAACDLVPVKPATDVLVEGCAYTVEGRRTEAVVAFSLEELEKGFKVFGERTWQRSVGAAATPPAPFASMEICWERAFGGVDGAGEEEEAFPENPAGVGFRARGSSAPVAGAPLPCCEHPAQPMRAPTDRPPPAGFGPIPPHWAPRARWAGTYDDAWRRTRYPLPPADLDPRFHQVAPPDQIRRGHLRGGEAVIVAGMTPEGRLAFRLPRLAPRATAVLDDGAALPFPPGACDTVTVDCERRVAILVWRSVLDVHGRLARLAEVRLAPEVPDGR